MVVSFPPVLILKEKKKIGLKSNCNGPLKVFALLYDFFSLEGKQCLLTPDRVRMTETMEQFYPEQLGEPVSLSRVTQRSRHNLGVARPLKTKYSFSPMTDKGRYILGRGVAS